MHSGLPPRRRVRVWCCTWPRTSGQTGSWPNQTVAPWPPSARPVFVCINPGSVPSLRYLKRAKTRFGSNLCAARVCLRTGVRVRVGFRHGRILRTATPAGSSWQCTRVILSSLGYLTHIFLRTNIRFVPWARLCGLTSDVLNTSTSSLRTNRVPKSLIPTNRVQAILIATLHHESANRFFFKSA